MSHPILTTPSPAAQSLEVLRQHFPQAIETDALGRIRINAAALQLAVDPANPAGVQVEEDGFELRWVGTAPAVYLTVYAPWIDDDNFMLGIKTLAESLGYSEDKLRLRG